MTDLLGLDDYTAIASQLRLPGNAFIDGKFVSAQSGEVFDSINPATKQVIGKIASCDKEDLDIAVKHARFAFDKGAWSQISPNARKEVLIRWSKLIKRHIQELATLESIDSGKPINDCVTVDLPEVIHTIIWYAELADKVYGKVAPTGDAVLSMIVKEPVGVVAAVLPWNFPLLMAAWKIAPALACGNSVIVKPAEETSMSMLRLAELGSEAGIPAGVLQVLPGEGKKIGKAIGEHHDIDMVSFTGSTEVGRHFLAYSSQSNLKKVVLELGGKNPFVVLDDAQRLEDIAEHSVNATFWNMGQNCSSGSRIIIHQSLKDELTSLIVEKARQYSVGNPLDPKHHFGAMVSKQHYEKVKHYIALAKEKGFNLLLDESIEDNAGYYISPIIIDEPDLNSQLVKDEIFGPVMCIMSAESNEKAVSMANDTCYGLTASLFTRDVYQVHHYARQIKAGTVTVNCFGEGDITTPFGGYKMSGFGGRDNGVEALDQYCETKTIWLDMQV